MKVITPAAHIDQLIRQTRAHHVQLSSMADLKANMLLTMSSIVVTLAAPRALQSGNFQWPLVVLIGFSLITILLAAYTVMPKSPFKIPITHAETRVKNPHFNLLFFGDFVGMDYAHFETEMEGVLNDPSRTYEVQVREIYLLGTFLAKVKYRYLRLAYSAFIMGLFMSILTFLFIGMD